MDMNRFSVSPSSSSSSLDLSGRDNHSTGRAVADFKKRLASRPLSLQVLLDELCADGWIADADKLQVLRQTPSGHSRNKSPITQLAENNLTRLGQPFQQLSIEEILSWLSDKLAMPWVHIDPMKINVPAVTGVMSFAFAKRHQILAVAVDAESVTVASAQPHISSWQADLERATKKPIKQVIANPADIEKYQLEFYSLTSSVAGAGSNVHKAQSSIGSFEQLLKLGQLEDPDANDQHIVNIVDWLLKYAFEQRASDIHIEPRREQGVVRFRIDGVLTNIYELPTQVVSAVTSRLKVLARMDVAEKRKPQDGRVKTLSVNGNEVELRLATLPTAFGEKLVIRIFDPDVLMRSFEDLGLQYQDLDSWQNMSSRPNGILLVTGPTGSGKTTTLYATLKQLSTEQVNVCTIEDPIEMIEPSFNQMQVQPKIDLSFSSGVRALMRQDPDIIMIGEIRDQETAEMAVQAALTGHLVISTVHTNDAPSAISRLLELGIPAYLLKATVIGVMAQRLVRTLCGSCKKEEPLDEERWSLIGGDTLDSVEKPDSVHSAEGCLSCRNTGYKGRKGIYEIMSLSANLRKLISDDFDLDAFKTAAKLEGMQSLRDSGIKRILEGSTTIDEVLRVAPSHD